MFTDMATQLFRRHRTCVCGAAIHEQAGKVTMYRQVVRIAHALHKRSAMLHHQLAYQHATIGVASDIEVPMGRPQPGPQRCSRRGDPQPFMVWALWMEVF